MSTEDIVRECRISIERKPEFSDKYPYYKLLRTGETLDTLLEDKQDFKKRYKNLLKKRIPSEKEADIIKKLKAQEDLHSREIASCVLERKGLLKELRTQEIEPGKAFEMIRGSAEKAVSSVAQLREIKEKRKTAADTTFTTFANRFAKEKIQNEAEISAYKEEMKRLSEMKNNTKEPAGKINLEKRMAKLKQERAESEKRYKRSKEKLNVKLESIGKRISNPEDAKNIIDKAVSEAPEATLGANLKAAHELNTIHEENKKQKNEILKSKIEELSKKHPTDSREVIEQMAKKNLEQDFKRMDQRIRIDAEQKYAQEHEVAEASVLARKNIQDATETSGNIHEEHIKDLEAQAESARKIGDHDKAREVEGKISAVKTSADAVTSKGLSAAGSIAQIVPEKTSVTSPKVPTRHNATVIIAIIIVIAILGVLIFITGAIWAVLIYFRTRRAIIPEKIRKKDSTATLILRGLNIMFLNWGYLIYHMIKYGFTSIF